jgi:hypothetical protein
MNLNDFELNNQYNLEVDNTSNKDVAMEEVKPVEEEKKPKKNGNRAYTAEILIEEPTGINALFKTFTMDKKVVGSLKGKGHESSDLNKIVGAYHAWHLNHQPKVEYNYFLERVRKLGSGKDMNPYLGKLRNHYKGTEILEEF